MRIILVEIYLATFIFSIIFGLLGLYSIGDVLYRTTLMCSLLSGSFMCIVCSIHMIVAVCAEKEAGEE